jgi:hypothetical protein
MFAKKNIWHLFSLPVVRSTYWSMFQPIEENCFLSKPGGIHFHSDWKQKISQTPLVLRGHENVEHTALWGHHRLALCGMTTLCHSCRLDTCIRWKFTDDSQCVFISSATPHLSTGSVLDKSSHPSIRSVLDKFNALYNPDRQIQISELRSGCRALANRTTQISQSMVRS